MINQSANRAFELSQHPCPDHLVRFSQNFRNEKLRIFALRKCFVLALQLFCYISPLLRIGILQSALHRTHTVVLEDEIVNVASNDREQLVYEDFALFQRNV